MASTGKSTLSGHIFALICVVFWGVSFIVSKKLMMFLTPDQLMWLRFIVAYITLWILHPKWYFNLKTDLLFLVTSLFGNTLYFLAENNALLFTQASNVSILVAIAPIMSALLIRFSHKNEKLSLNQKIGFSVAFAGVILVVFNGVVSLEIHPIGDILALLAALCWAIYCMFIKLFEDRFHNFLITRKVMFYGILSCTPVMLAESGLPDLSGFAGISGLANIAGLLFLGCICSAACYILWNSSLKSIGILKTNVYIYGIPLVTLVAGAMFLDEHISLMGFVGFILVIGGMIISNRISGNK